MNRGWYRLSKFLGMWLGTSVRYQVDGSAAEEDANGAIFPREIFSINGHKNNAGEVSFSNPAWKSIDAGFRAFIDKI